MSGIEDIDIDLERYCAVMSMIISGGARRAHRRRRLRAARRARINRRGWA